MEQRHAFGEWRGLVATGLPTGLGTSARSGVSYNLLCYLMKDGRRRETRVGDDQVRDEDDHDLLTFAESGIRLREEIELAEAELRQDPSAERRSALQARLSSLTGALARNTRQSAAKPGERGFLDYAPPRPAAADDAED
jgi:hypothetical protein